MLLQGRTVAFVKRQTEASVEGKVNVRFHSEVWEGQKER